MKSRYTAEQIQAIDSLGAESLISAAAGSGKTAVLVERILKMIESGISISSMLIVTFTNAAAAEMKERIKKALEDRYKNALDVQDFQKLSYYRSEIKKLQSANISTLHSFCIEVIKKYAYLINLGEMRLADEAELLDITEKCSKDLFIKKYENEDQGFLNLLNTLASGKDKKLYEIVMEVSGFSKSLVNPKAWLLSIIEVYKNDDIENSIFYKQLLKSLRIEIKAAYDMAKDAHSLSENFDDKAEKVLLIEKENLEKLLALDDKKIKDGLEGINFDRLNFKKDTDPDIKEQIKKLRDKEKAILKDLKKGILFLPIKELLRRQKASLPLVDALMKLTVEFDEAFLSLKQARSHMDFSDLEHYALSILKNEEVCKNYSKKFEHIFIDEYQDTNAVQEAIICAIKREDNVFMVGDVKQSIYRFRQADPTLFINKYETFGRYIKNEKGVSIDLRANFRSASYLIDAINAIFKDTMSKELGEIDYDERAMLTPGFEIKTQGKTNIYLIDTKEEDEQIKTFNSAQKEALLIADIINGVVGQSYYDAKSDTEITITYGDIAILLRSAKGYIGPLTSALSKLSVPCYEDSTNLEYSGQEVAFILSLLKVIDNIKEDVSMLSVMHSIIGSFSVQEMVTIRNAHKDGLYYDALVNYRDNENDSLSEKIRLFLEKINKYQKFKNTLPVSKLIERILSDTGYYLYAGALPSGKARQINIEALLYKARTFESNIGGSLYEFISYMQKAVDKKDGNDAASITREQNLVRVMTVHKSKGLEFPVVILAGTEKSINKPNRKDFCLHKDLGLGLRFIDKDERIKSGSISFAAVKDINDKEGMSEELRIMYVALTRAIAQLHVVGLVSDTQKSLNSWQFQWPQYAKNWLDWIMPVAIKNTELFNVNIVTNDNALKLLNNKITFEDYQKARETILNEKSDEFEKMVSDRLNFKYQSDNKISTKTSVTALLKQEDEINLNLKIPEFIEHEVNLGALKGTVTHELLSHIDLNAKTQVQIENEIQRLLTKKIFTQEEIAYIDVDKVNKFLNSTIAKRMRDAKVIKREQPFTIKKSVPDGERIVQGIIDCCFIEDDSWVLLDFKTDSVYGKTRIKEKAEYYRNQLELYKEALIINTGLNVKETYIYFLAEGTLFGL